MNEQHEYLDEQERQPPDEERLAVLRECFAKVAESIRFNPTRDYASQELATLVSVHAELCRIERGMTDG